VRLPDMEGGTEDQSAASRPPEQGAMA
jgi:hypothetical protein